MEGNIRAYHSCIIEGAAASITLSEISFVSFYVENGIVKIKAIHASHFAVLVEFEQVEA